MFNQMMHIKKIKRGTQGYCNICKSHGPLTWDHVPPKGGISPSPVEIKTILQEMKPNTADQRYKISQNGTKYRTICKDCNSLLGRKYDTVLNEFSKDIGQMVKSSLILPTIIKVSTRPQLLMKAILGHILAGKKDFDTEDNSFDEKVRKFIFDDNVNIPKDIFLFYWIYPYENQVLIRDVMMPSRLNDFSSRCTVFQIIKYFPIAYIITNISAYEGLSELTCYRDIPLHQSMDICIKLDDIKSGQVPFLVEKV